MFKDRKNLILLAVVSIVVIIYIIVLFVAGFESNDNDEISQQQPEFNIKYINNDEMDKDTEDVPDNQATETSEQVNNLESKKVFKNEPVNIAKDKVAYLRKPLQENLENIQEKPTEEPVKQQPQQEEVAVTIEEGSTTPSNNYPTITFLKKPSLDIPLEQLVNEDREDALSTEKFIKIKKVYRKPKYTFYTIRMNNLNTGEHLATVFYQNGEYSGEAMKKINKFLRDYRSGEVKRIDPNLIMLIYRISRKLDFDGYVEVISGYRSTKTNNMLRRMGRKVAKNSMHSQGKAIDIKIPGVSTKRLRDISKSLRAGGVGYYPNDGFVHVDTGDLRNW